jgi:hypothetical protein
MRKKKALCQLILKNKIVLNKIRTKNRNKNILILKEITTEKLVIIIF